MDGLNSEIEAFASNQKGKLENSEWKTTGSKIRNDDPTGSSDKSVEHK